MMPDKSEIVVNAILCFITTSRNVLPRDNIVTQAVAFYKDCEIRKSKEVLFAACKEKPKSRRPCSSQPNPSIQDVLDMIEVCDKADENGIVLPKFVADSYNSLPPSNGFDSLAAAISSIRDELTAVKEELSICKQSTARDQKSCEDICLVKEDIADIKLLLHTIKNKTVQNDKDVRAKPADEITRSFRDAVVSENFRPTTNEQANSTSHAATMSNSETAGMQRVVETSAQTRSSIIGPPRSAIAARRNLPQRRDYITGSRNAGESSLTGVPRQFDLFIGGCSLNCTEDDLKSYCSSIGVTPKACTNLETKASWYTAFKITVAEAQRDKLMSPDLWPEGIFLRKFYAPRGQRMSGNVNF